MGRWIFSVCLAAASALAVVAPAFAADPAAGVRSTAQRAFDAVKNDYLGFYSRRRLIRLGLGYGIGGLLANTDADDAVQDWYQDNVRGSGSDDFADVAKKFGERKYLFPASLVAAGLGELLPPGAATTPVGDWGKRSLRAYAVGWPAMVLMQNATGGSRPGETGHTSRWRPFGDNNGVSGHAFIGAVPFLTLAHMTENRPLRYLWYGASALAGWSRINDNAHFPSQALLGWYTAFEAVGAVNDTDKRADRARVSLLPVPGGVGLYLSQRW